MPTTELRQRISSGIILGTAVIALTLWSFWSFAAMCAVGAVILMKEWWGLTKHRSRWWLLVGAMYIGGSIASLIWLRAIDIKLVTGLFALVWGSDVGAYVVGKKWGNHKIAPSISPGKSWEGLAGAMLVCCIIGFSFAVFKNQNYSINTVWVALWFSLFCMPFAIIGLAGDMFESHLKRHAGVKDSGALIPGHGGLFDRVDALMPCAIVIAGLFLWLMVNGDGH